MNRFYYKSLSHERDLLSLSRHALRNSRGETHFDDECAVNGNFKYSKQAEVDSIFTETEKHG